jgi:FixJ family two-component response regulator
MTKDTAIVFVVDDDLSVRSSLRRLLTGAGYHVQVLASTRHLFEHGRPDVACCVILDVGLPDVNGLEFQESLKTAGINVPIIFITGRGDVSMSVRAMKAGAIDFICKPFEGAELMELVNMALERDREALECNHRLADLKHRYATLSPRECEVFAAVTSGMLNKQVGYELGVAEKTIKVHRAHVMEKMQAVAIVDLARMADSLGIEWAGSEVM